MAKRYYEQDGNVGLLKGKTIGIIGYGSQGHAHALNLRDSGLDVVVGLPEASNSRAKATSAGLKVLSTAAAAKAADVMMILVPDHVQGDLYASDIAPNLTAGKGCPALIFSSAMSDFAGIPTMEALYCWPSAVVTISAVAFSATCLLVEM